MSSNPSFSAFPTTRREFLDLSGKGIGLLAFSQFAPRFLVQSALARSPAPETDRPILVVVQLAGGNDGLNTVIPFEDPAYYRLRPSLAIPKAQVLRAGNLAGFHPSCGALRALFDSGKLAVVQNVGYPNPNRRHFRSTEIWESGLGSTELASSGWIGRYLDHACAGSPAPAGKPAAVYLADEMPLALFSEADHRTFGIRPGENRAENEETRRLLEQFVGSSGRPAGDALLSNSAFLKHTLMDALVTEKNIRRLMDDYRPAASYPTNPFAAALRNVAALVAARLPTRVYFVSLSGFDTHSDQLVRHASLLGQLSDGLAAFQRDLEGHRLDGQVTTMTFSEFGRRPGENRNGGTEHGTAAPLFVMGSKVKGGFHGTAPSLAVGPGEDIVFSTDFRRVYATALERWLGNPAEKVLGQGFDPLPFI